MYVHGIHCLRQVDRQGKYVEGGVTLNELTSFQSNDVRGAQKSEFLLLLRRHSRRVSGSPARHTLK